MRDILARLRPVFEGEGLGNGGNGGGDGGGGWSAPQGLPTEFVGSNADETLGKMVAGYTDLNTRFSGMRDKLAKMPSAPEKPDLYQFEPDDKLKPYFGDVSKSPVFNHARAAAHKHGLSQDQFSGFIADVYSPLVDQGVLARPFDPAGELKSFQTATGLDQRGAQEALVAAETFAKGLTTQLKDVPEALKNDVGAMLIAMTDTAAGNVLLRALSGRLSENGIRISGEGGGEGAMTADDLKKLDTDPRIDPRNRDHKDPNQRFDESLRKRYDEGYNRLFPSR
jgi:hypothetical protein